MAVTWRYWAPVIVPDMTGSAVVQFAQWFDTSPVSVDRWLVVAWMIAMQQHDQSDRPYTHPEPITTNGIIHELHHGGYSRTRICLEIAAANGRIWCFSNGRTFTSLAAAQAYATDYLKDQRVAAENAKKQSADKRRKARAPRDARPKLTVDPLRKPIANLLKARRRH
jgi:hypothetical protein